MDGKMNKKYRNVLFLKDFDNKNEIQNENTWRNTLEKWKEFILHNGLLIFVLWSYFFSTLVFLWYFSMVM